MRHITDKRLRPWLLCIVVTLAAVALGYLMRNSPGPVNEGVGFCTIPLVIFLQSSLIGCIGAYYRNWPITLAGTVCMAAAQCFIQAILPDSTINPDPTGTAVVSGFALLPAVTVHGVWHAVAIDLGNRRKRPRKCTTCGYNLTGNKSGTCPECGENIQSTITRGE